MNPITDMFILLVLDILLMTWAQVLICLPIWVMSLPARPIMKTGIWFSVHEVQPTMFCQASVFELLRVEMSALEQRILCIYLMFGEETSMLPVLSEVPV